MHGKSTIHLGQLLSMFDPLHSTVSNSCRSILLLSHLLLHQRDMNNQGGQLLAAELIQLLNASGHPPVLNLNQVHPIPTNVYRMLAIRAQLRAAATASRNAIIAAVNNIIGLNGGMANINEGILLFELALRAFYDACVLQSYELHFYFPIIPGVQIPTMNLTVESGPARIERLEQLSDVADQVHVLFEVELGLLNPDLVTAIQLARRLQGGDMLPVQVVAVDQQL